MENIIEIIKDRMEDAERSMEQSHRLAPNSYGAGADWGMHEMCKYILEDIEEIKNK